MKNYWSFEVLRIKNKRIVFFFFKWLKKRRTILGERLTGGGDGSIFVISININIYITLYLSWECICTCN